MTPTAIVVLLMRLAAVGLFLPFSALDKLLDFGEARHQAEGLVPNQMIATLFIVAGLMIEIFCSLAIITGVADRLGAAILAAYCVVTAILFKQFWTKPHLLTQHDCEARGLFWDFLKNCALGAALFGFTIGADGGQLHAFLHHPLASSDPYGRPK